jgi:hypothetical protein
MSDLFGFELFLEERGEVKKFSTSTKNLLEKYKDRLPDYVLDIWKNYGLCSYSDGFIFLTSPEPFNKILEIYFGKNHSYTVFCHTSFGDLLIWDTQSPSVISLDVHSGQGVRMVADGDIDAFFTFGINNDRFYKIHRYDLHLKAVEKFGQLEPDQVFAFVPALALGGSEKLENIKVSQLREYLAIIAELAVENNREAAAQDA